MKAEVASKQMSGATVQVALLAKDGFYEAYRLALDTLLGLDGVNPRLGAIQIRWDGSSVEAVWRA